MHRTSIVAAFVTAFLVGCASTEPKPLDLEGYEEAPAFLKAEIEERVAALPYQTGEQLYDNLIRLTYIGEPAIPFLLDGLASADARTRASCAYVLGLMRDRRTIQPLRDAADDKVPEVRYEVATSLAMLGERSGYPILIEGLSDPDIRNRYKAHEALKLLTNLDFGFRHDDEPAARRDAVRQWEEWWERMRREP